MDLVEIDRNELKEKVKAHITEHPELFDIQHIGLFIPGTYKIDLTKRACIAGITLGILEYDLNPNDNHQPVTCLVRNIFGLDKIELFHLSGWEPETITQYHAADAKGKAKLACEQIDKFIT